MTTPVKVGPFELLRPIGEGGMAVVWSGVHAVQRTPVAIKFVTEPWATDPVYRQTFENEVRAVAGLDHPSIVMVFDHGEVDAQAEQASGGRLRAGTPYLVMEMASGGALDRLSFPLVWPDLKSVLLVLLDALAHAHARGVVHRDLKPANVLMCGPGDMRPGLKLTDFGIAHALQRQADSLSEGVTEGTPEYMAPEQCRAWWRDYGPWTDLYALGCMAFEMATGAPPFVADTPLELLYRQLEDPIPRLRAPHPLPEGFETWVRRMLQKEPWDRFQTAADAAWALAQLADPEPDPATGALLAAQLSGKAASPTGDYEVAFRDTVAITIPQLDSDAFDTSPDQRALPSDLPTAAFALPDDPLTLCDRRAPPLPDTWSRPSGPDVSMQLVGTGLGLYGLRTVPLIDREGARSALWEALREVGDLQHPRLVVLHGNAGTGKSRVVEWVCQRAHEVGGAHVWKAFHSTRPGAADGLPRMVAEQLGCVGLDRADMLRRVTARLVRQGVTDPYEHNALVELVAPATEADIAAGAQRIRFGGREEGYALVRRMLQREAADRPVIVWLDDVNYSRDSIDFAEFLLAASDGVPLPALLVLTARDEALALQPDVLDRMRALAARPGAQAIKVGPLAPQDHSALVQQLLGLEGELARRVEERTAGNPLFAVQLVGDWVQRGVLEVGERGFVLRPGEEAVLPDDLYQVWALRIERLMESADPEAEATLQLAALLGREVIPTEWVTACAEADLTLDPELVGRLFRERLAARSEAGWTFAHAALREALERRAAEGGRWQLFHQACVRMLRRQYPPNFPGMSERIGRHLFEAGAFEEALAPLLDGASHKRVAAEYRDGVALLELREAALERGGVPEADPRWGAGWTLRSWIASNQGRIDEAWFWSERACQAARAHGWATILPQALLGMGVAARDQGHLSRAVALTDEAYGLYETARNRMGMAHAMQNLGVIARYAGDLDWAQTQIVRALNLHEKIGNASGVAQSKQRLAEALLRRWKRDEALALVDEARGDLEALSAPLQVALGHVIRGDACRLGRDPEGALASYRQAREMLLRLGSSAVAYADHGLALMQMARRQYTAARASLEGVRDAYRAMQRHADAHLVAPALLACAAARCDWAAWDRHLAETAPLAGEGALVDVDVALLARHAGDLARAAGEHTRAHQAWRLELAQWQRLREDARAAAAARRLGAVPA